MPLSIKIHRRKPAIATTVSTPPPAPSNDQAMSPLPPQPTPTPPPTHHHIVHHISPPPYNATYENFLLFLVVTYFLWALFRVIYMLLRIGVWLFEQLQAFFAHVMTIKFRQPEVVCVTKMWIEGGNKSGVSGKAWSVESRTYAPTSTPEKRCVEYIVRQRSGTV